jgi:hypothetical protein
VRSPPKRKDTSEKPSRTTRRATTEATAGVHISGMMRVSTVAGFIQMYASTLPDSTMTMAK